MAVIVPSLPARVQMPEKVEKVLQNVCDDRLHQLPRVAMVAWLVLRRA